MEALTAEPPSRVEIRGHQISVISSSRSTDLYFARMHDRLLQILGHHTLSRVLLLELYNHQLLKVLSSLGFAVQSLDIANCALEHDLCQDFPIFQKLSHLNVYSSHLREDHLNAILKRSPGLKHFSLHLVAGARSINVIFQDICLPCLQSVDLRGRFLSTAKCFSLECFPVLSNLVIVETLGSRVHLGHLVDVNLQEILLGKTLADKHDLQRLGNVLCDAECRIRRMHLFAIDIQPSVNDSNVEELMEAFRLNQSLVEVVMGAPIFHIRQRELKSIEMRNRYLIHGVGKLEDARLLPNYLSRETQSPLYKLFGKANREQVAAIYFMVSERPDLFQRPAP